MRGELPDRWLLRPQDVAELQELARTTDTTPLSAAAGSVGSRLPGAGLLNQTFGNGDQEAKTADTLPTHNALDDLRIP